MLPVNAALQPPGTALDRKHGGEESQHLDNGLPGQIRRAVPGRPANALLAL